MTPDWIQQAENWCASVENSTAGLMLISALVSLGNAAVFWVLVRRIRGVRPHFAGKMASDPWCWLIGVPYWLLLLPMLAMAVGGHGAAEAFHSLLPAPLAVACMAFQFAVWVYGGVLLIGLVVRGSFGVFAGDRFSRTETGTVPRPSAGDSPPSDSPQSRRDFLRKAAFGVPAVIVTAAAAGGVCSQLPPVIRRVQLPVRAPGLRGLRIVQFSDVHIGSYLERDRLREISEAVNAQRPDLVVCTGDLIDNRLEQLEFAQNLLGRLKPRVGTFMCMGNHEYIAAQGDEAAVKAAYAEAGATVLVDTAIKLPLGGSHLWLAGTDFPGAPGGSLGDRPSTAESMDRVLADMRDDGAPRIVLSHHPKTFFEGRERQIDLMLSGHTHGGQISLGRIHDHALTPNLPFEFYHKGLYEHEGRRLYVNSGIGSWLPVRINCPPEVTLVELV
ncbi:MAG: metallophosphoesterase [Planctomycetes bacterium]|nr:metallophosphoesterase [Planctomycetota bacterium]